LTDYLWQTPVAGRIPAMASRRRLRSSKPRIILPSWQVIQT